MTIDDLKNYFQAKNDSDLARILKKDRSVISYWRKKIPLKTQAVFEIQTNGKLLADRKALDTLSS